MIPDPLQAPLMTLAVAFVRAHQTTRLVFWTEDGEEGWAGGYSVRAEPVGNEGKGLVTLRDAGRCTLTSYSNAN